MKKVFVSLLAAAAMLASASSSASVVTSLHETYVSGAQFQGTLTFSDNYVDLLGVDGTLTGGGYGNVHFGWVWFRGDSRNVDSHSATVEDWLMNGNVVGNYSRFIGLSWTPNQSSLQLVLVPNTNVYYAGINNSDAAVRADVPEPASLALMGMGMLALGALRRRRQA